MDVKQRGENTKYDWFVVHTNWDWFNTNENDLQTK